MPLKKMSFMKGIFFLFFWMMLALIEPNPPGPDDFDVDDWDGVDGSKDEIKEWWQDFQRKFNYPLYVIILAGTSDTEAVQVLLNHRRELDAISNSNCCFIFFRDLRRMKNFEPFVFSEYTPHMYPLARFIGIDVSKFPCFLFFEQLDSGQYIHISLQGLSQQEIIILARKIMGHLNQSKRSSPFDSLRRFKYSQTLVKSSKELGTNVFEIARTTFVELLKSLIALHK